MAAMAPTASTGTRATRAIVVLTDRSDARGEVATRAPKALGAAVVKTAAPTASMGCRGSRVQSGLRDSRVRKVREGPAASRATLASLAATVKTVSQAPLATRAARAWLERRFRGPKAPRAIVDSSGLSVSRDRSATSATLDLSAFPAPRAPRALAEPTAPTAPVAKWGTRATPRQPSGWRGTRATRAARGFRVGREVEARSAPPALRGAASVRPGLRRLSSCSRRINSCTHRRQTQSTALLAASSTTSGAFVGSLIASTTPRRVPWRDGWQASSRTCPSSTPTSCTSSRWSIIGWWCSSTASAPRSAIAVARRSSCGSHRTGRPFAGGTLPFGFPTAILHCAHPTLVHITAGGTCARYESH
mmetsp:Transcript_25770/g.67647  ORF Transcript_25770/g.67647 Transcript_25770/m.67647 type:complete len:361 (+) Transcript_25770:1094-2176(+)